VGRPWAAAVRTVRTAARDVPAAGAEGGRQADGGHGRAVQVDSIKPVLKAPVTKRLILAYDEPLSNFAFKFNMRRYNMAPKLHEYLAKRDRRDKTRGLAGGGGGGGDGGDEEDDGEGSRV